MCLSLDLITKKLLTYVLTYLLTLCNYVIEFFRHKVFFIKQQIKTNLESSWSAFNYFQSNPTIAFTLPFNILVKHYSSEFTKKQNIVLQNVNCIKRRILYRFLRSLLYWFNEYNRQYSYHYMSADNTTIPLADIE